MKHSQTKKVHIYPIRDNDGTPLDLINVLSYVSVAQALSGRASFAQNPSRQAKADEHGLLLDRVDTFIGRNDRGEYVKVGSTENLSAPGVIFRYASYVREQEGLLGYYLECYHNNMHGLVYTEKGSHYRLN